jgi:hypothetical protein
VVRCKVVPFQARRNARRPALVQRMMFFFSNRTGCLGSIAISLIGTLLLLLVFGWI